MPKICYKPKNFHGDSLERIGQANKIIAEYSAQGYSLTLRQLYYQFVARALIPNTVQEYKRLGSLINDGRLAGKIDWLAIEDRTRGVESISTWDSPNSIVEACSKQFRFDKWERQPYRIEIWVEKEALAGVFQGVAREMEVPLLSCRGYTSQSEMWRAARRLKMHEESGQETRILHFGDHDPSGIDMTRDIQDRLRMFDASTEVRRLALNMDQIEQYSPPPNPAKETDSRWADYSREFGDESWELDALEPEVLTDLARRGVLEIRDDAKWEEDEEREEKARGNLDAVASRWDEVCEYLGSRT